jgi:hypothetical protein
MIMVEKCENCGAEYEVTVTRLAMRDKDKEYCCVCGQLLRSWNEAKTYDYKLIKKAE